MNVFNCKTGVEYDLSTNTMSDFEDSGNWPLATNVNFTGVATDDYATKDGEQFRKFIKCKGLPNGYHTIYLDGNDDSIDEVGRVLFSEKVSLDK